MRVTDLIAAKRDGLELSGEELYNFAMEVGQGLVKDYQAAAWLMAAYIRGLTRSETLELTKAMRDSGRVIQWRDGPPLADKHSTGGVGDKISLMLAPLAAACGLRVPMISGRSLGHTGGTLDKLESIPGMNVNLSLSEFVDLVEKNHVAMCGQTDDLAPADRKLYALRDATSTVTSIPLICASILSKKLAENTHVLVFDVKTGRGAFMTEESQAMQLAGTLVAIAREAGVDARAVISSMDHPLGQKVGNTLEVQESMEVLQGRGPQDVRDLTLELTSHMLQLGFPQRYQDTGSAKAFCTQVLDSGKAFDKFVTMINAQGGDLDSFESLPPAAVTLEVRANRSGFWNGMDAYEVGEAVRAMGGGRYSMDQEIAHEVGWEQLVPSCTHVKSGELLGLVHAAGIKDAEEAAERISASAIWDKPAGSLLKGTV